MIKTGIYDTESLADIRNIKGIFGGVRRASITLYDQLSQIENGDQWAEHILFLFSDGRGAYKRTYAARFDDFDDLCVTVVRQHYDRGATLRVHDAAVSDGRTACDFFARLSAHYEDIAYTASDYDPMLEVITHGRYVVTLSGDGQPLEIVAPPFVFNLVNHENFLLYPVNYLFFAYAKSIVLPQIIRAYRSGNCRVRPLRTFSPEACALERSDGRFGLTTYDLNRPFEGRQFDIVRAMNVLNPRYFSAGQLDTVIDNVFHSLADGGLLIAGSNGDPGSAMQGGIYRREGDRFKILEQAGEAKAFAEPFILAYRRAPQGAL